MALLKGTRRWYIRQTGGTLIAAGGLLAAACAGGQASGSTTDTAKSLKPQAFEFWGPDPKVNVAMKAAVDGFVAKFPNLNITVASGSLNFGLDSQSRFLTAIAANTPPDVVYMDRNIPRSYAAMEAIVPLDDRIRRSKIKPEEWWPYLRNDVTQAGKVIGIPTHTDARVFNWNKQYFREAGVDPEKPPATWDEVTAISAKLVRRGAETKLDRTGFMPWGGGFHTGGLSFFVHLWQAGGESLTPDERKPRFHEPPGVKALDWMMTVARQIGGSPGYKELVSGLATGPGLDAFSAGRLGMHLSGQSIQPDYVKNVPALQFGVAEIPIPAGGKPAAYTGGFALCVPKNAPHVDAGFAFMEHWISDENQLTWCNPTHYVPSVRRVAEGDGWLKADPIPQFKLRAIVLKSVATSRWVPTRPGSSELVDLWVNMLTKASELQTNAQDMLADMARQTQVVLDKWYDKYKV